MPPDQEVRRCRKCQAEAVLPGVVWTHTTWGVKTGSTTREFRCQACGAEFTLRARPSLVGVTIAGVLLLPTCVGLPILAVAWWMWKQDAWNPVVPDAAPVTRRFPVGPPERTCGACSGVARAVRVTRNTTNGIPTGTEYAYQCASCQRDFVVESPWGHVFQAFAAGMVGLIAVAFLSLAETPGWRWGGFGVCALLTLFLAGQGFMRLLARVRNPVRL